MESVLNIIVIGLILLIGYWWANQGLFSSILHCLCVIAAGAIALAFWEPLVTGFLLKGNKFDNYSWGLTLGLLFVGSLFILRLITDRLAPNNVKFPEIVNNILGGLVGLWAGVLTMGMTMIACGFIQAPVEIMGFVGWARTGQNYGLPSEVMKLWIPAAEITEGFYATLSRGALSPFRPTPLAEYYPQLAGTALSLHRDTFFDGDGQSAVSPESVTVGVLTTDANFSAKDGSKGAFAIEFSVDSGAFDGGEQFILSAAQARLLSDGKRPEVAFPTQFNQPNPNGERATYKFDDMSNYASSVPGEQDARIVLVFPAFANGGAPRFLQLKGVRFALPTSVQGDIGSILGEAEEVGSAPQDDTAPEGGFVADISNFVMVKNSIMPAQLNTNILPPMTHTTNRDGAHFVSGGKGTYKKGATMSVSRSQRIRGFHHTPGTEIVLLDASRRLGGIDIYGDGLAAYKAIGRDQPLELVDSRGKAYKPIGWVLDRPGDVELAFDPSRPISRLSDLPSQPSSGEHKLRVIFVVPTGVELTGLRIGKTIIGRCSTVVLEGSSTD